MEEQLINKTHILLGFIDQCMEQFNKVKNDGKEGDFYLEVKPFADKVKKSCDEWIVLAKDWLKKEKPPYINENQFQTTYDHIEKMAIQSFYQNTSRKNFISSYQSAQYILLSILNHFEKSPANKS